MKRRILVALLLILAACPVSAQLTAVIADDGTERIVLKSGPSEGYQQVYAKTLWRDPAGHVGPLLDKAPCATLGSQSLEKARSTELNLETLVARYNLVNLWLGNVCHGKSDAAPDPGEAKAWLLSIQNPNFEGDVKPFLATRRMLVQFYLFGSSGFAPDYPAALALLNEDVKGESSLPALGLSYVYEHGLGVPKDPVQARVWLERAAQAGSSDAKMLLAQARELNTDAGGFSSYLELSKGVYPPAWFRLGIMYLQGRGTEKDPCKAQELFQKAARHLWDPVPQAKKYLDQIREQKLCIPTVVAQPEQASPTPQSKSYCPVDLPADRGELHPKRLHLHPKVLHNRLEYNLYMNALGKPDPQQKGAAMEEFVALYPHSKMKIDALEQAMGAYQASGNAAKVAELAARVLQAEPGNVRALAVLLFLARDCATRALSAEKELSQLAQRGLAALPEWQKTQGASLPDGEKLRDEMAVIFAGAAGWGALQARDYAAARQFYEKALASGSKNLQDLYQLAIADLEMTPIDPNGFWYCGKAISIAQLQNKAAAAGMSPYCKARFKRHGGKLEEWDRLVSSTEKDTAPPRDFAKSLSLQEPDHALQGPKTPVVVAPLASSEKGDPITRLAPGTDKDSPIGAGVGSGAAGGMATEPPGQRPEVISLSNNSLPSGDFVSRYGWYVQHMQRTVAAAWHVPELTIATDRPVEISFEIEPDGAPTNVRIWQSSGSPALDMSALRTIQRIDKFSPPPTHEKIIVKFVFDSRDKK